MIAPSNVWYPSGLNWHRGGMRAARATTGSKNRSGTHSTADCSLEEHVAGSPVRTMDAGLTVRHTGAHVCPGRWPDADANSSLAQGRGYPREGCSVNLSSSGRLTTMGSGFERVTTQTVG